MECKDKVECKAAECRVAKVRADLVAWAAGTGPAAKPADKGLVALAAHPEEESSLLSPEWAPSRLRPGRLLQPKIHFHGR